jgi:hypothetical protein
MQEQPTWEAIKCEATNLEIWFGESAGAVCMEKYGSVSGWFQDSLVGRQAAWTWLEQTRQAIEQRDQFRSLDPPPRRRMFLRWLWRR